jgi:hypothetical protein
MNWLAAVGVTNSLPGRFRHRGVAVSGIRVRETACHPIARVSNPLRHLHGLCIESSSLASLALTRAELAVTLDSSLSYDLIQVALAEGCCRARQCSVCPHLSRSLLDGLLEGS